MSELIKKSDFYTHINTMQLLISGINENLSSWSNDKSVSKWFLKHKFYIKQMFAEFYKELTEIKQELTSKC